jgi:hypothetical protein
MQPRYWLFKVFAIGIIITWSVVSTVSGQVNSSIVLISHQGQRGCPSARIQVLYKGNLQNKPLKDDMREAGYTSIFKSLWNILMAPVNSAKQSK